ncbi:MAG: hypothetical protein V1855_01240 [bacterium]
MIIVRQRHLVLFVSVGFSFVSNFSYGIKPLAQATTEATGQISFDNDQNIQGDGSSIIQDGKHYFYTLLTSLKDVSYDTDKIIIPLPKFSYEIVIDLKCKRSGDLFAALQEPHIFIQEKKDLITTPKSDDFSEFLIGVGKSLLKDKAFQQLDQLSLVHMLEQFQTPESAFIIKLILLSLHCYQNNALLQVQNGTQGEQGQTSLRSAEFYNEVFRLLFRLSNTKLSSSALSSKKLSAYIPDVVRTWINGNHPHIMNLIDDVWATLLLASDAVTTIGSQAHGPLALNMVVFNDEQLAKNVYQTFKDCSDVDIIEKIQNFLKQNDTMNRYSILGYQDIKYLYSTSQEASPFQFLVGKQACTFAERDQHIKDILPNLDDAVQKLTQYPTNLLMQDTNNRWWVIQVANKFGGIETLKLFMITLIKSFKKYQTIQQALPTKAATKIAAKIQQVATTTHEPKHDAKISALQKKLDLLLAQISEHEALLATQKKDTPFAQTLTKQIDEEKKQAFDLKQQRSWVTTEQMLGSVVLRLFELNPEFGTIFNDISNCPEYASLKNDMLQAFSFIASRSHFLHKHKHVSNHVLTYVGNKLGINLETYGIGA